MALRTRIAERLLELAGAPQVPVVTGLGKPLSAARQGVMFGHEGIGLFDDPQPTLRVEMDPDVESSTRQLAD